MARFKLTQAYHFGQYRVKAGGTVADTVANSQPGDMVPTPALTSSNLPAGLIALDGSATTMLNASRWAGIAPGNLTGRDSIDA
jgi:hypothetical protein